MKIKRSTLMRRFHQSLALKLIPFLVMGHSFSGCALVKKVYEPNPQPTAIQPVMPQADVRPQEITHSEGSLWPSQGYWNLFADNKALRRGDIVQVAVVQKSAGKKDATTETDRESSITASIKKFLGWEDEIQEHTTKDPELFNATAKNEFKGNGMTERTDDLTAIVSAVVTDVLSDGNLVIYGHQTVKVNKESSVLTVQGIIRPADIGPANTIASGRIANARIEFDGSGVVTDKQHPGWAMRAFDWVWPF